MVELTRRKDGAANLDRTIGLLVQCGQNPCFRARSHDVRILLHFEVDGPLCNPQLTATRLNKLLTMRFRHYQRVILCYCVNKKLAEVQSYS